jgi:hypothetical protein
MAEAFPEVWHHPDPPGDDRVLRLLYDDIEGDQRFYDVFASILLGAAAAFNLMVRIVEAQAARSASACPPGGPARAHQKDPCSSGSSGGPGRRVRGRVGLLSTP